MHRLLTILLTLAILATLPLAAAENVLPVPKEYGLDRKWPDDAWKVYQQGQKAYKARNWAEYVRCNRVVIERIDHESGWYNVACGESLMGNHQTALVALQTAVEKGYVKLDDILNDSDLAPLRALPGYNRALAPAVTRIDGANPPADLIAAATGPIPEAWQGYWVSQTQRGIDLALGSNEALMASTGEQPIRVAVHREGRDSVLALPNGPLRFQVKRFPEGGILWLHRSQRQMHVQQRADAAPAHWQLDLKSLR